MIISTKYQKDDQVYWIDTVTGKVTDGRIYSIRIEAISSKPVIMYRIHSFAGPLLEEEKLHLSKEALIKTL